MKASEIVNARITTTFLGEDHGCLTAYITVESNLRTCDYGGYCLEYWGCKPGEYRAPDGFGAIIELMKALEVDNWEALKGQYVRLEISESTGRIVRVGHFMKEKWFSFKDYFNECRETSCM